MTNILLTGFEPFGGLRDNPSARVADSFNGKTIGRYDVAAHTLPVTFKGAPERLEQLVTKFEPELLVCLGLAGGEKAIRLERQANNQVDFRISDNAGEVVQGCVRDDGPDCYMSNLPLDSIRDVLQRNNIPVRVSDSAGTFVCNSLMYSALNLCNRADRNTMCGFIHLPYLPEQVMELQSSGVKTNPLDGSGTHSARQDSLESMPLMMQIDAVQLILDTCIKHL